MKKRKSVLLILAVMTLSLVGVGAFTPLAPAQAASKEVKAYKTYLKKQINKGKIDSNGEYYLYDFDKNGVKELVYTEGIGARAIYRICLYRKGKVVRTSVTANSFERLKKSKYVVASGTSGMNVGGEYVVYKIASGKLKKVVTYRYKVGATSVKYYKNSKRISGSAFEKFQKKVVWNIGKSYSLAEL